MKLPALLSLALCLIAGSDSYGQLLVKESFDYPSGSPLSAARGGSGLGPRWNSATGSRGEANIWIEGISFDALRTSGNALILDLLENEGSKSISVHRTITAAPDPTKPMWVSFLCQFEEPANDLVYPNATVFLRVVSHLDRSIKYRVGLSDQKGTIQHGADNRYTGSTPRFDISPGKPFLLVAYFPPMQKAEKSLTPRSGEKCLLWVFDKDISRLGANPSTTTLNRYALARAEAPALNESIDQGDSIHVGLWGRGTTKFSAFIDEIHYGHSLSDVIHPY